MSSDSWRPLWQLPSDISHFVNRAGRLERLKHAVGADGGSSVRQSSCSSRIYTVTGPPGVGKASLVVHWAHTEREGFEDGILYFDMGGFGLGAALGHTGKEALDQRTCAYQLGTVMQKLIDEVGHLLPLRITASEFGSTGLTISGDGWLLRINAIWRLTYNGSVVASRSISEGSLRSGNRLIGDTLIKIDCQSYLTPIDPCFTLSSGGMLEIWVCCTDR